MSPVAPGEDAQLAAGHRLPHLLLYRGEAGGRIARPVGEGGGEAGRGGRVGLEGALHVDPVEGMQMVEMDDVVLHGPHAGHEVADQLGAAGDGILESILHRPDRGDGMDAGADAADTLGHGPGVARVTALEDPFDATELGGTGPGVADPAVVGFHLDAQVPLDAGDGVDDNPLVRHACSFLVR
jgi:hypothetical protein